MTHEVVLTKDAERDLEDLYRYIAEHDSQVNADYVLERPVEATEALRRHPVEHLADTQVVPVAARRASGPELEAVTLGLTQ
jgi:toxin ParE1/3/4